MASPASALYHPLVQVPNRDWQLSVSYFQNLRRQSDWPATVCFLPLFQLFVAREKKGHIVQNRAAEDRVAIKGRWQPSRADVPNCPGQVPWKIRMALLKRNYIWRREVLRTWLLGIRLQFNKTKHLKLYKIGTGYFGLLNSLSAVGCNGHMLMEHYRSDSAVT